jgi:hypothetical protein
MVQTSSWLYQSLCHGCRPPSRPVLGIAIRNEPFGSFWDDNLGSILRNVHMQIQQIQQIQILSNSDALPGPNISTFSKSGNFPGQTDSGIVHLSRSSASWQGMPGGSRKDLRVKSSPRVKCKWLKYIYIHFFVYDHFNKTRIASLIPFICSLWMSVRGQKHLSHTILLPQKTGIVSKDF